MKQYLYVMLSHTDTRMGRLIRFFTGSQYNHVSLCLNGNLQQFVSFARFRQGTPLAGGYVTETAARLLSCGKSMPVRVFRIEISQADSEKLETLFNMADHTQLIYNSLGAILSCCHIPCPVPGAYTCLEFACAILGSPFPSIRALETALAHLEIYRGDLFDILEPTGIREGMFFQKQGFRKSTWNTVVHFKTLLWRILRLDRPNDPIACCSLDIALKKIPQSSL